MTTPQKKSTTQLSLNYMRKQGYVAVVTEHWLSFPERDKITKKPTGKTIRVRRDLFNFADVLAFHPAKDEVVLVQTTTTAHQADRIAKIGEIPEAGQWLQFSNRRIEVHGWRQSANSNRWQVTVTEMEKGSAAVVTVNGNELPLFDEADEDDDF